MHPHHARALKIARRNYQFCKGVVDKRHAEYLHQRARYLDADPVTYPRFSASVLVSVVDAKRRLELSLVELQNQLSVVITVERMLENA